MNKVRFYQIKVIKMLNRLLVLLLVALLLLSTQGNIGFLWIQTYYYVTNTKEKVVKKVQDTGSPFLTVDRIGNSIGDYSYFVSGMVDPEFISKQCGTKAKDATIIWNTCIEAGLCPEAIAGIINNYLGEAHPWQYNGAYVGTPGAKAWCLEQIEKFNKGEYTPEQFKATKYPTGQSTAFGAWQWLGGRKLNLAKSARTANADIGSIEFQINFLLCEIGLMDNLSDYDIRGSKSHWESYLGTATKTPKEYAIDFACYFEGYKGTQNPADYSNESSDANRTHIGKAQKIYDEFMAAANEYAAAHSSSSAATYSGNILPADFATRYNIDTAKMTAQRWEMVERAYYWCDYGSGDYILYSQNDDGRHWKDYDLCVANKTIGHIDCSKFVQELYKSIGIDNVQGNTSSDYAKKGFTQIDFNNLVAGDIVAHRSSGHGHVQMFLGWIDPSDHSKGYYKASASTGKTTAPQQVLISTDKDTITNASGYGDGKDRAYRHGKLPIGNGSTFSQSRLNINASESNKVLLVGDSRTEGMCIASGIKLEKFGNYTVGTHSTKKGTYEDMTVICCTGAGKGLLQDDSVLKEIGKACSNGDSIVIALGINDLAFDWYYDYISALSQKTKVYWCTVGPVTGNTTLSESINSFNSKIASGEKNKKYKVLGYAEWIKSYDYENGISNDGLHYRSEVNRKVFNTLYNECCK